MGSLLPVVLFAASLAAGDVPIDERILALDRSMAEVSPRLRLAALAEAYEAWMPAEVRSNACNLIDRQQLEPGFRATAHLARYFADETWLFRLRCFHAALQGEGATSAAHDQALAGVLVATRNFAEANALRRRIGLVGNVLPGGIGWKRHRQGVLVLEVDGSVRWSAWRYRQGWEVVAFVHPSCSFSQRALAQIASHSRWKQLRERLRLVVQREPEWRDGAVRKWNERHPELPMLLQASAAGWKGLDSFETPVFHIMHGGKVVRTVVGWRRDGQELAAQLAVSDIGTGQEP